MGAFHQRQSRHMGASLCAGVDISAITPQAIERFFIDHDHSSFPLAGKTRLTGYSYDWQHSSRGKATNETCSATPIFASMYILMLRIQSGRLPSMQAASPTRSGTTPGNCWTGGDHWIDHCDSSAKISGNKTQDRRVGENAQSRAPCC